MQITNLVTNILTPKGFTGFIEFLIVVLQIVYVLFSFMLTRQIKVMNINFKTPAATFFKILADINFLASIIIVIFAILLF